MTDPGRAPRYDVVARVSIAIGVLIVLAIVFYPFRNTHFVTQDDSELALVSWRELPRVSFQAARVTGRVYFLVGMWFAWVPYASDSVVYFKAVQLAGLFGNFLAIWYLALRLGGNRSFAFLTALIAVVTMQARWEHNLVSAFPWAFSTSLTLMMVALGLLVVPGEYGHRPKRLLSACCFFLSLFTYESFLLYAVAFPIVAWPLRTSFTRAVTQTLRAVWPHVAFAVVYLSAYLGFRLAFPSLYEGNQTHLSPSMMFGVWSAFGRSALPGTAYLDLTGLLNEFSENYAGHTDEIFALPRPLRVEWLILALIAGLLCAYWLSRAIVETRFERFTRAAIVGLVMASAPQIPHALTFRYQLWVSQGTRSHVPTYLIAFGTTLLLTCAITSVAKLARGWWPWTAFVAAAVACVSLYTAFANFYVAKSQTIARRKWDLVDSILRSPQFAALPEDAVLLAPTWWHGINIMNVLDDYWTRYVRKKTGKRIDVVRSVADFKRVRRDRSAYFSRYVQEGQTGNQFMLLAPVDVDAGGNISAAVVDVFVLSSNRSFSAFAALQTDAPSTIEVDDVMVTDFAEGSAWLRIEREGVHEAPFRFRLSSHPVRLDPDSIVLSDVTTADRFIGAVRPDFGDGFYSQESSGAGRWNWGQERAVLVFRNNSAWPREIDTSFEVSGTMPSCHVTIMPEGRAPSTSIGAPIEYRFATRLPSWGDARIAFATDCPRAPRDPRNLRFMIRDLHTAERVPPRPRP